MTHNQISWWTLQETIRHNKESEVIGHRQADAAMASAGAAWAMAKENERHNKAYEMELNRHNRMTEATDAFKAVSQDTYWKRTADNTAYQNETNRMKVNNDFLIDQINATNQAVKIAHDYEVAMRNTQIAQQQADTQRMHVIWSGVNDSLGLIGTWIDNGQKNFIAQQNAFANNTRSFVDVASLAIPLL